jgi:RNA polymerase sigma-70 factor, ECF subfamily
MLGFFVFCSVRYPSHATSSVGDLPSCVSQIRSLEFNYRPRGPHEHDYFYVAEVASSSLRYLGPSPEEIEDLVQEICATLMASEVGFDGKSKYSHWIRVVARNHYVTELRRRGRACRGGGVRSIAADERIPHRRLEGLEWIAVREESAKYVRIIRGAVKALALEFRSTYLLLESGLKHEEIAALLGVAQGTIKSRVHRVSEDLDRVLVRAGADEGVSKRLIQSGGWVPLPQPSDHDPESAEEALGLLSDEQRRLLSWHSIFDVPIPTVALMAGLSVDKAAEQIIEGKRALIRLAGQRQFPLEDRFQLSEVDALYALPVHLSEVLVLNLLQKQPLHEVASTLKISLSKASRLSAEGKRALRRKLEDLER